MKENGSGESPEVTQGSASDFDATTSPDVRFAEATEARGYFG
jgi:hypothetical protein